MFCALERRAAWDGKSATSRPPSAVASALVQAGWTELRDALATHGISPERLVMSVTAPSSSGAQDGLGSGSSGSSRQDFGQAAFSFAGSQSGQQRPDHGDSRTAFGWSRSSFDGITSTQPTNSDSVAPVTADALSRINYRA